MKVEPYLNFDGRCEEAIEFYKSAIGAEVTMLMRFKDSPEKPAVGMCPPGADNKIMHANRLGCGDHGLVVGLRLETGDVLRHRAGEQLHILRQVSDVAAEQIGRPLVECGAVEPDVSAHRLPDPDEYAGER